MNDLRINGGESFRLGSTNQRSHKNKVTAANAGWRIQFRLRGSPHRPGVAEFFRSAEDSNANGVPPRSPGLARGTSAYPGLTSHICPNNPNGVAPSVFVRRGRNPDGVPESNGIFPQGSRSFVASTLGSVTERPWRSQILAKVIRINRRTKSRQAPDE